MTPAQICQVQQITSERYEAVKKTLQGKKDGSGFESLRKLVEAAFCAGLVAGLASEARAWAEVNRIEDLIIDLLRYAPDSEVAQARVIERSVIDEDPAAYAKAVTIANGGVA